MACNSPAALANAGFGTQAKRFQASSVSYARARKPPAQPSFDDVVALSRDDMAAVDALISKSLESDVALVSQVSEYIVLSGGKRLRPMIVLLHHGHSGMRACSTSARPPSSSSFTPRRCCTTTWWIPPSGAAAGIPRTRCSVIRPACSSVIFFYSRAFQMMVDIDSMRVMQILADATNTIAAGEVMQLMNVHDPDTTEEAYRQVIYRKTARLFEAGAQIASVLAEQPGHEAAMVAYGQHLGVAFQLIDDALDFNASADELGKNLGDDLAEGKATLPLIHAMQQGSAEEREMIRKAIVEGGLGDMRRIQAVIESTGALQYTAARAQEAADLAIEALSDLPDSDHKQALVAIADFAVQRRS